MPRQQSKPRLKPTRKQGRRNLPERKPFVTVNPYLANLLHPHLLLKQHHRLVLLVKISRRHGCKYACLPEGNPTPQHCRVTQASHIQSPFRSWIYFSSRDVTVLREVAEFLAGQTLSVDVETVSLAQHFPRLEVRYRFPNDLRVPFVQESFYTSRFFQDVERTRTHTFCRT